MNSLNFCTIHASPASLLIHHFGLEKSARISPSPRITNFSPTINHQTVSSIYSQESKNYFRQTSKHYARKPKLMSFTPRVISLDNKQQVRLVPSFTNSLQMKPQQKVQQQKCKIQRYENPRRKGISVVNFPEENQSGLPSISASVKLSQRRRKLKPAKQTAQLDSNVYTRLDRSRLQGLFQSVYEWSMVQK